MMRDIPNSYSSSRLIQLFDDAGFLGTYDFVYLPVDFRTNMSLGYAFVNFVSSSAAQEFMLFFHGFSNWHFSSPKVCKVFWSAPNQGLEEHVERYRNSPVMHENVPDDFKPALFTAGKRIPFPELTLVRAQTHSVFKFILATTVPAAPRVSLREFFDCRSLFYLPFVHFTVLSSGN